MAARINFTQNPGNVNGKVIKIYKRAELWYTGTKVVP